MNFFDKETTLKTENKVYDFSTGLNPLSKFEEASGVSWEVTKESKQISNTIEGMELFFYHDPSEDINTEIHFIDIDFNFLPPAKF